MSGCGKCGKSLLSEWYFCPNCGKRTNLTAEESTEKRAPKKPQPSIPTTGTYGQGVRSQVFEVIVRQGMAGAPWRQICAGPMQVNNIPAEAIQEEITRRQELLKKGKDPKSHPGDGQDEDDDGDDRSGWQASSVPKKPIKPSGETSEAVNLPPPGDSEEHKGL